MAILLLKAKGCRHFPLCWFQNLGRPVTKWTVSVKLKLKLIIRFQLLLDLLLSLYSLFLMYLVIRGLRLRHAGGLKIAVAPTAASVY